MAPHSSRKRLLHPLISEQVGRQTTLAQLRSKLTRGWVADPANFAFPWGSPPLPDCTLPGVPVENSGCFLGLLLLVNLDHQVFSR